jgi:hypothetical protein
MAIQPCHYCSQPVQSNEYFVHDVACAGSACQAKKRESDERAKAAIQRTLDREKTTA